MVELDKKKVRELRGKAQSIQPTVRVGKAGITEQVIGEIRAQLKKKHLVKIKILGCDKVEIKQMSVELEELTGSSLVDVRGNTLVLWKKG